MVRIHQHIKHESGIPLGGIGTGTVEVRPDGLFHEWQIFNVGKWSPNSPCNNGAESLMRPEDLVFLVRTRTSGGDITVRYLALHEALQDLHSFPWLKCVQGIIFDGTFPIARLTYEDERLPVDIRAEIFSPFIPNDSRNSGIPGFYINFHVENTSAVPVEVSITGCLMNAAGIGQKERKPRNRLVLDGEAVRVAMEADDLMEGKCTTGSMAFSASGGEVSYLTGAFRGERSARFWRSTYGTKIYSCLHPFRDEGRLRNLSPDIAPALPYNFKADKLPTAEQMDLLTRMLRYSFVCEKFERLSRVEPNLADDPEKIARFLDDLAANLRELGGCDWGEAALCTRHSVDPGGSAESLFTVSWHFPNHISPTNGRLGHMYENWFGSALEVDEHLTSNFRRFREETRILPELLYSSGLDGCVADAVSSQLSTLTKCTWWTRAGNFGVWEGLGCGGFHTMDISYAGSFPIISLFPDLQKSQMLHGARFQLDDGRVHHFFVLDFSSVDNGFDRVDMNPQFVMMAARDYLWTGDRTYLEELWPNVIRAMDYTASLDGDGDGLPDHGTGLQTYDLWNFAGTPSYISSLWLGALKAAMRLAGEMGDDKRASDWRAIYERGLRSMESKLWNGDYYILWKDEAAGQMDECCMTAQMSGDWFCGIMGWGAICSPERIRKALSSILKLNFRPDAGLINAGYPPGAAHRPATSGNLQAEAAWTGIEYSTAALLTLHGMVDEGLAVVRDLHSRYLQAGRFWNHMECGDHHYRALSSWTLLPALSGFRLDVPSDELAFGPKTESDSTYPFFAPGVIGVYRREGDSAEVEVVRGSLTIRRLSLPVESSSVALNGKPVASKADGEMIEFAESLLLQAGDVLRIC